MIAISIFFTYSLQFYVPMEIIWKNVKGNFNEHKNAAEYSLRVFLVVRLDKSEFIYSILTLLQFIFKVLTVAIAVAIPDLGPFISLIGAVCLSTLGLIFPSVIELVTYYERPGFGTFNWILWKNVLLIMFGVIGFLTGTYVSVLEIIGSHTT